MPSQVQVPAAQYLRMSTDQQQYSILSQRVAIERYAQVHGFNVVQSYEDPGRSGLTLKRRPGLARLLHDVVSGEAAFKAVLVYDVSRWGRFQDSDEAAHYEFMCKTAGVPIHYCAEVFANDGSLPSSIMKALKRVMAGEYSRELSVKVARAKRLVAAKGYRVGGAAGYGFRRMFLTQDGKPKRLLDKGEYVSSGRVVLVPGPDHEVAIVKEVYRLCVEEKKGTMAIARYLNSKHISPPGKRSCWYYQHVEEILTNPKYMGQAVLGRTACTLNTDVTDQPSETWTVKDNAFDPIIDPEIFASAQATLRDRTFYRSNDELLARLKALLSREGMLSEHLIDVSRDVPSVRTYIQRFGSISKVYELIGYDYSEHIFTHPRMRKKMWRSRIRREHLRSRFLRSICKTFGRDVEVIRVGPIDRPVLRFCDGLRISVLGCPSTRTPLGHQRWRIPELRSGRSDVTLLCLCNNKNDAFQDYYLAPSVPRKARFAVKHDDLFKLGTNVARISQLRLLAHKLRE